MRRYAFVDKDENVSSIIGWADERELPADYEIPLNCKVKTIEDDNIDINYFYDCDSDSFKIKNVDEKEVAKNEIIEQLSMLDDVLPRCVEDLVNTLGMDITKLPTMMQDRLRRKKELREQLNVLLAH